MVGGTKMVTVTEDPQAKLTSMKTHMMELEEFLKSKELHAQKNMGNYTEYWQAVLSTVGEIREHIRKSFDMI